VKGEGGTSSLGFTGKSYSRSLSEYQMMDKVQQLSNPESNTLTSEPVRISNNVSLKRLRVLHALNRPTYGRKEHLELTFLQHITDGESFSFRRRKEAPQCTGTLEEFLC
jgi:hypothetical protein